jgi:hypothetical protein
MSCFRLLLRFEAEEAPNHETKADPSPSPTFGSLSVGHDEPLLDTNSTRCEACLIGSTPIVSQLFKDQLRLCLELNANCGLPARLAVTRLACANDFPDVFPE